MQLISGNPQTGGVSILILRATDIVQETRT